MKIKLVCLEDGILSCGFRKMAAFAGTLAADVDTCYVSTASYRSVLRMLRGDHGGAGRLDVDAVDEIAHGLADADLVGFSSMTGYADLTRAVSRRLRELAPRTFQIWGGIHPIIHPDDAIRAPVDAICTGEGEHAFAELLEAYRDGRDFTATRNFWFRRGDAVVRNGFRPLLTPAEMEALPFPKYGGEEWIHERGRGFVPLSVGDYLASNGLAYNTVWSIGCPFHCSFCGNTRFIANDPKYRKIRHTSARYIVEEVKAARRAMPHVSSVGFHDDSFMAIPYRELEEFATRWREEVGLPFAVYGLIPNYVRRDKMEVLTWAGMNRVRMGIQSGSRRILEFYKRPTPPEKVEASAAINASFASRYHIPPAYDIIVDNPIETRQDVLDTLELLWRLERPYTINLYSLKVIPNTELERVLRDEGVDIEEISSNYSTVPPRWANLLVYLVALWRPPRGLWERLLARVEASATPQPLYPVLGFALRSAFLARRALHHLRFMDFSTLPGRPGWVAWRLGLVDLWRRRLSPRPPRPDPPRGEGGPRVPVAAEV